MPDYVIILLHYARTHTRLHACYDKNDFFSRLYNNYMYILLHTYNYAITVYVLLRCIVSSICIFSTCFIYYVHIIRYPNEKNKSIKYIYNTQIMLVLYKTSKKLFTFYKSVKNSHSYDLVKL